MKAHAVGGRDKPKDVYDLCYCLDEYPDAIAIVARDWRATYETAGTESSPHATRVNRAPLRAGPS
jgi:hypothetical protein